MARCIVEQAEEILDREFQVLNSGFVRLVDYMGSDQRIVQAARVSYGEGTRTVREDAGLIDYLLRNRHTSPFEQVVLTFHLKIPVFVARQWIRHRTARINEVSGRYSIMPDEFFTPELESIAKQSSSNKQGRESRAMPASDSLSVQTLLEEAHRAAYSTYQKVLETGTARELARVVLPLSLYTEFYWQIDLHNLFHFLALRLDEHAQYEIRMVSETVHELSCKVCPLAFRSFDNHYRHSQRFSGEEVQALKNIMDGRDHGLKGKVAERFEQKLHGPADPSAPFSR